MTGTMNFTRGEVGNIISIKLLSAWVAGPCPTTTRMVSRFQSSSTSISVKETSGKYGTWSLFALRNVANP